MQKFQALAISQIDQGVVEYTRGVLCALGHKALFDAWHGAGMGFQIASDRVREAQAASTPAGREMEFGFFPDIDPALLKNLDAERARAEAAWAPILALKEQAQEALEAADPMGMGQAA